MISLTNLLNSSNKLDDDVTNKIKASLKQVVVKKGTVLQRSGKMSSNSYFVKKGLLKSYVIDEKGKEHIFTFAPENWLISDIESQSYNSPAVLFIEAIEDSEIEIISKHSLELFKELPQPVIYNELQRLLKRCGTLQRRVLMLMSFSAKERYNEFIKTYPDIVQRVPQRLIASYLGITPQALSTLRKKYK
ncbi:MAG: Crp/Fnr family transcriptional regulator [Cyclobacteriaceae bacterium]|nr:Crp/Fnr family transcriptional regulator [Cyclobacteriaceae bacterium]